MSNSSSGETLATLGVSEGGARRVAVGREVSAANGGRTRRTIAPHHFIGLIF